INARVREESRFVADLRAGMGQVIVGQKYLVERLLVCLLANGHVLLEGVPGLAKTLSVRTLAALLDASFQRIQFTPDLLPADLIGTQVYNPREATFTTRKGPLFANLILADEINRAPAKVQSALLEAMQERQVTIGPETFPLPRPFLVLATQNPIEQEGTYPLPEAQVDRFMLKLRVGYPSLQEERRIMDLMAVTEKVFSVKPVVGVEAIARARGVVDEIYLDEKVKEYILAIVFATREPERFNLKLKEQIRYGASPRASLFLAVTAKAHAFLDGRGYVTPQDVKALAPDVLRHRVIVSYEAEAEELTSGDLVARILSELPVP
ncbi:MAG TPA: MoxR family ATPase, partial [Candidatus Methanoperedens sp.]|nr:MoxR family ATPase [Candidatus Methanoperedens sp.]